MNNSFSTKKSSYKDDFVDLIMHFWKVVGTFFLWALTFIGIFGALALIVWGLISLQNAVGSPYIPIVVIAGVAVTIIIGATIVAGIFKVQTRKKKKFDKREIENSKKNKWVK